MKRAQFTALIFAVLLFGAGAIVGVLGDRYYNKRTGPAHVSSDQRGHYVQEMQTKLHLTDDQVQKLQAIMNTTKAQFKAARNANMMKIKQEHVQRVRAILTPAQIPIYMQLVEEHERHAQELEKRESGH